MRERSQGVDRTTTTTTSVSVRRLCHAVCVGGGIGARRHTLVHARTHTQRAPAGENRSRSMKHEILVTSDFDGGNGRMRGKPKVESGVAHVDVAITPDPYTDTDKCAHYQWFNFRLVNLHSVSRVVINVVNAGGASYTDGWINYNACYSFNRNDWLRAQETTYGDGVLSIPISLPEGMTQVQVAYFAPYSQERHFDLIATSAAHPRCRQRRGAARGHAAWPPGTTPERSGHNGALELRHSSSC